MLRTPTALFATAALLCSAARSEVIYDNTQNILGAGPAALSEYGDQVDLQGTGRTLTSLTFFYYGDFDPDAHQIMKVRLYTNETPYDNYRNQPTTLIYESGNMPMNPGYNIRTLDNLNVKLPLNTLTFTVEFKGLKDGEIASLVLCSPPTVGFSFNEFWQHAANGHWLSFLYSSTDFTLKANGGLKLVAKSESVPAGGQTNSTATVPFGDGTNLFRFAQTFTPTVSGRLDHLELELNATNAAARITLLETGTNAPGTNVLGSFVLTNPAPGLVTIPFYDQELYLLAGTNYAIQIEVPNAATNAPLFNLASSTNDSYADGQLWMLREPDGQWQPAALSETATNIDAVFAVSIVPANPVIHITSPAAGTEIPFGTDVHFGAELRLPAICTLYRMRFFDGDQELEQLINPPHKNPPYEVIWTATNAGPHTLKAVAEDTFGRSFRSEVRTVTVSPPPPPPVVRSIAVSQETNGVISISFNTVTNETIQVQYSSDLQTWKNTQNQLTGTGALLTFTDDGPPNTEAAPKDTADRFYRVRFTPPSP